MANRKIRRKEQKKNSKKKVEELEVKTKTDMLNKLIIALIVLILFSFCCPTSVKARGFLGIDIPGQIAGLFY